MFWKNKLSEITLLSENWEVLGVISLKTIPVSGDVIYLHQKSSYFDVIQRIFNSENPNSVILVINRRLQ